VWGMPEGGLIMTLSGHEASVACLAYSPDGQRLVTGGRDKALKLWDEATGQEILPLDGQTSIPWSVAFSPDGMRIASTDHLIIRVWDTAPLTAQLAAQREARGLVRFLCGKQLAKPDVLAQIRSDVTIAEPVRRRALDLCAGKPRS